MVRGAEWTSEGVNQGAYQFDGVDDQIDLTKHLPDMSSLTISVWINYQGTQSDGGIFSDYTNASAHDLLFALSGPSTVFIVADKGDTRWKAYVKTGQGPEAINGAIWFGS